MKFGKNQQALGFHIDKKSEDISEDNMSSTGSICARDIRKAISPSILVSHLFLRVISCGEPALLQSCRRLFLSCDQSS